MGGLWPLIMMERGQQCSNRPMFQNSAFYRSDLEYYSTAPRTDSNQNKLSATQASFNSKKAEFEKLRSDVQIKLKFLDENRVKVMQKQLLLFHNAVSAYFSGNQTSLEATMKQFAIKVKSPNSQPPSWMQQ